MHQRDLCALDCLTDIPLKLHPVQILSEAQHDFTAKQNVRPEQRHWPGMQEYASTRHQLTSAAASDVITWSGSRSELVNLQRQVQSYGMCPRNNTTIFL